MSEAWQTLALPGVFVGVKLGVKLASVLCLTFERARPLTPHLFGALSVFFNPFFHLRIAHALGLFNPEK